MKKTERKRAKENAKMYTDKLSVCVLDVMDVGVMCIHVWMCIYM